MALKTQAASNKKTISRTPAIIGEWFVHVWRIPANMSRPMLAIHR